MIEIFGMQELKPEDKLSSDKRYISIQFKDKISHSRLEIGCSIFSDAKTIAGLCRGKVRPMSAFLSGKLKIEGDRKYFAIVALALKESMNRRNVSKLFCKTIFSMVICFVPFRWKPLPIVYYLQVTS